jgi:thiol-disulfide isomerase/thioredoxin
MTSTDREGRFRFDVVDETGRLDTPTGGGGGVEKRVPAGATDVILVLPARETKKADAADLPEERFEEILQKPAPPLHVVAWLNSAPRTLEQLRGKVVLIDFWSVGCGPCVASLPGVQRAADEFAAKGVVVIGLHDAGIEPAALQAFAKEHQLAYPLAIAAPDDLGPSFGASFRAYRVRGIPAVAVIDRQGRLVYRGHFLGDALALLSTLLAAPAASTTR